MNRVFLLAIMLAGCAEIAALGPRVCVELGATAGGPAVITATITPAPVP